MVIFPRARWTRNCVSVSRTTAGSKTASSSIKTRCSQRAKGRCYLPGSSAPGCHVPVPNARRLSLSWDLSCLRSRAAPGEGAQTPVGPPGTGVSTGGGRRKPRDFKTFRGNTLLKFQPRSLSKTSGVGSCSRCRCCESRVNLGESAKVTSGWEVTSDFPSPKWQQDLSPPRNVSLHPLFCHLFRNVYVGLSHDLHWKSVQCVSLVEMCSVSSC